VFFRSQFDFKNGVIIHNVEKGVFFITLIQKLCIAHNVEKCVL